MALTAQQLDITKYVVGLFKAAPGSYLDNLEDYVDAGNTAGDLALVLADSTLFKGLTSAYADAAPDSVFVTTFLTNLLGNSVSSDNFALAEQALNDALAAGFSRAQAAVLAVDVIDAVDPSDATWGGAKTLLDDRIDAAANFTENPFNDPPFGQEDAIADLQAAVEASGTSFNLTAETAAGADVMRLTGDQTVRIDFTNPANQVTGLDYNVNDVIDNDGVENNVQGVAADFEIVDAYSRNPLNHFDSWSNFRGNIYFDGTGFEGDGVSTDGNIFLGGLGADQASGGIGNDFMAGGGVAQDNGGNDYLFGGRNADFFFVDLSALSFASGDALDIDGGETADDSIPDENEQNEGGDEWNPNSLLNTISSQDSDWLLIEASDDDEPVRIDLAEGQSEAGTIRTEFMQDDGGNIDAGDANDAIDIENLENVDASGNLYGFLDDLDVALGENGMVVDGENVGIGATAQLVIEGSDNNNILIGGFDNDHIDGSSGDDLLMGGNLNYLNNPNLLNIVNNGMDGLEGGLGNDHIVFEADGGWIRGGLDNQQDAGIDSLWVTREALGTQDADDMTEDGVLRFDLLSDDLDAAAGYGGADLADSEDQTNYLDPNDQVEIDGMENVIATGLGAVDYEAAGTNDPELLFNNQQNHYGYEGDLDLRGTDGANILYANTGDDVLEGRQGNDSLMGGEGNDDFYFSLDSGRGEPDGDDVDVIHRQTDADDDNIWDTDDEGNFLYGQDFGLDESATVGESALILTVFEQDAANNPINDLLNITVNSITTLVYDPVEGAIDVFLQTADMPLADTHEDLVTEIQAAIDNLGNPLLEDADGNSLLSVELQDDNTILITHALGYELEDLEANGALFSVEANNIDAELGMVYGEPEVSVSEDRLIFKAYEDRDDNEGVDDDAVTGSTISLRADGYAEDVVIHFASEDYDIDGDGDVDADTAGTRISEDQTYRLEFDNLTTEDIVTLMVNGVEYQLQVGVFLDGTQVDAEDGVGPETQADIQDAFLNRFADFINSFMDDDTAAGEVNAAYQNDGSTIVLTQANYAGEETVFMVHPTVDIQNLSGGEGAEVEITNVSDSEIHLLDFDGRDNALNAENVLFIGEEFVSRAVLETAADAGGELSGSDAVVINGGVDDLEGVAHNLATEDRLDDNFAVHGDDLLIGGLGDDVIYGLTGDDRIVGSAGDDTVDGGVDYYSVLRVGDDKATVEMYNAYEAEQEDAEGDVLDIDLIRQTENGNNMVAAQPGQNVYEEYFDDTLLFQQADFMAGVTQFTVALNNFTGLGDAVVFDEGGAGQVFVDVEGDGFDADDHTTTFTNFENIRTVSGIGRAVAGDGQGMDTLDLTDLSDASSGVTYYLTDGDEAESGDVFVNTGDAYDGVDNGADEGDVLVDDSLAAYLGYVEPTTADDIYFGKVDGVEDVYTNGTQSGDDLVFIDESEAAKNNTFNAGIGDDAIVYQNDYDNPNGPDEDVEPQVTITVNASTDTDTVTMTAGRVGQTVAVDTLVGLEHINLEGNTAEGPLENDIIDVTAMTTGAVVDYVNQEIRDLAGNVELTIAQMAEMETVRADGDDTVIVADGSAMSGANATSDSWDERADIVIDSYLNYDLLDERDEDGAPLRLTIGDLRGIADGTADTADSGDIPEVRNFAQYTFDLSYAGDGEDNDTVDYSNEVGGGPNAQVTAVYEFNPENETMYVMVNNSDNGPDGYRGPNDRVDALVDVENVVASQSESIIDLTASTENLKVRFNANDGPMDNVDALDRDIFAIQLTNLDTAVPFEGVNFLEYFDAGNHDDVPDDNIVQPTAAWNRIEGSDNDEMIELTDHETQEDHEFNLRGGDNEVNYNELTRSIAAFINVIEYDEANPAATGLIDVDVTFTDGNLVAIGGQDDITSYNAQNEIAAGGLRIEASQDAEDSLQFDPNIEKLFILGEVVDGSDQITVTLGPEDAQNTLELTGFEFLIDATSDDTYTMDDLSRVFNNLTLIDNGTDDRDAIAVGNDAIGFQGSAADTINLEELNDQFAFDFDVLDITAVTQDDLLIVGDADTGGVGRDTTANPIDGDADDVVVGNLDLIDNVTLFQDLWLTNASITSAGTEFVLDFVAGELQDDDSALFTYDGTGINASLVTDSDLDISVNGATAATLVGGEGDDLITGGGGDDFITGGAGDDVLDGGIATEVRQIELAGILDAAAGGTVDLDMGTGGLTLTLNEVAAPADVDPTDGTLDILAGSGANAVGTALAQLVNANIADINAVAGAFSDGVDDVDLLGVTFDSNILTFTFEAGYDVQVGDAIAGTVAGDAGSLAISSDTTITDGGDGGLDTFIFADTADDNGVDTINGFQAGVGGDVLDFTGFLGAAGNFGVNIVESNNLGTAFTAATIADTFGAVAAGFVQVFMEYDGTVAGEDEDIWFVDDANEDSAITADEVALVGAISEGGDFIYDAGNFA